VTKSKRPSMPDDMFNGGAIAKLTGGAPPVNASRDSISAPTPQEELNTAPLAKEPQKGTAQQRKVKPTSFYLPPEQLAKLDELAFFHNKRTGQRINRNDIVRHLIKKSSLEDLMDLVGE
jgi:hypothetical protein